MSSSVCLLRPARKALSWRLSIKQHQGTLRREASKGFADQAWQSQLVEVKLLRKGVAFASGLLKDFALLGAI